MAKNDNIICTCPDCRKVMYPFAGKFKAANLKAGDVVKAAFQGREHMWAIVTRIEGTKVHATLDNDPVIVDMKFGDAVVLEEVEIEDMMPLESIHPYGRN
jgi:uncharacterized protein YegJ (DUF2314 family)